MYVIVVGYMSFEHGNAASIGIHERRNDDFLKAIPIPFHPLLFPLLPPCSYPPGLRPTHTYIHAEYQRFLTTREGGAARRGGKEGKSKMKFLISGPFVQRKRRWLREGPFPGIWYVIAATCRCELSKHWVGCRLYTTYVSPPPTASTNSQSPIA